MAWFFLLCRVRKPGFFILLFTTALLTNCSEDSLPPVASLKAFPEMADTTLSFEFNASDSKDDNTFDFELQFRWDFESDGIWDTNFETQPIAVFRYDRSGIKTVTVEVKDVGNKTSLATLQVEVKPANRWIDTLTDPRDHQQYRIVRIQNDWWMAENLNFGEWIPSNIEQTDNQIAEKYYLHDDSVTYRSLGGIYRWTEALDYSAGKVRGLCPPGWHMPTLKEWQSLLNSMDTWYAWTYYGSLGLSGLNIDAGTFAKRRYDQMIWEPDNHFHWSCDNILIEFLGEMAPWFFYRGNTWGDIGLNYQSSYYDGSDGLWIIGINYASVRCIKNQ